MESGELSAEIFLTFQMLMWHAVNLALTELTPIQMQNILGKCIQVGNFEYLCMYRGTIRLGKFLSIQRSYISVIDRNC